MDDECNPVVESSQSTNDEKGNSQGNSSAKPKVVRSVPNYLRASSGSCHDACKYGKTHEFVKKPRPPMRRRPTTEIPVEIYTPDKKSVKEVLASKPDAASLPCLSPSPVPSPSSPPSPSSSPSPFASPSHDVLMLAKQKSLAPGKSPPSVTSKSVRQGVTSQMKASLPSSSKSARPGVTSLTKAPSPSSSKSVRQGVTSQTKAPLPSSSKSIRQGITSQTKVPLPSTSRTIRQGMTSQTKAPSPCTSKSTKKELPLHLKSSSSSFSEYKKQGPSSCARSASPAIKPLASSPLRSPVAKASNMTKQKASFPSFKMSFSPGPSDSIKPREEKSTRYSSGESSASTSGSLKSKSRSGTKHLPSAHPTVLTNSSRVTVARNGVSKASSSSFSKAASKKVPTPATSRLSPKTKNTSQLPVRRASASSVASSPSETRSASVSVRKKMIQSDGSQESEGSSKEQISTGLSDAKKLDDERTPEKTLHVIKVETDCQTTISAEDGAQIMQSQLILSPGSLNSISHSNSPTFSSNGAVELNTDSEYTYGSESDGSALDSDDDAGGIVWDVVDGEHHGKTRNSRLLSSEENQMTPTKLKFRRGKVVEPEAIADAPPRRIRFRRRKALTNDQGSSAGSHRIKVKVVDFDKAADVDPAGEKVVLRHQDAQAKKNEHGLFNNVIEETASKLVETRKSKVKALVGAFETVFSLQEGKPSGDKPSPQSSPGR